MKAFLENKQVKLGLSVFSAVYALIIFGLAYLTVLYNLVIENLIGFSIIFVLVNILFFGVMLLSRDQIITSVVSILLLPMIFIILILNFGNWILFIPPFVVAAIMFFACRASETVKAIFGTMFLLIYILGLIAFFLIRAFNSSATGTRLNTSLPSGSPMWEIYSYDAVSKATANNVSPDGKYRFYLLDMNTSTNGKVDVYVEPNDEDIKFPTFTFYQRGKDRKVAGTDGRGDKGLPEVQWVDNDTIQYKISGGEAKRTDIRPQKKDYFAFLS